MTHCLKSLLLIALLMLGCNLAFADTFFTSPPAASSFSFAGVAPPNGFAWEGLPGSFSTGGATFTNPGSITIHDGGQGACYGGAGNSALLANTASGQDNPNTVTLTITFSSKITSLNLIGGGACTGASLHGTLSDGFTFDTPAGGGFYSFFGFTAAGGISSLTLKGQQPTLLSFLPAGSTNPIPEPGSIVLLGSGFSTAAYLLRRRRFGRVRG